MPDVSRKEKELNAIHAGKTTNLEPEHDELISSARDVYAAKVKAKTKKAGCKRAKTSALVIALGAVLAAILFGVITLVQALVGGYWDTTNWIAYEVESRTYKETVDILHIAKEKGEEPIYTLRTDGAYDLNRKVSIPESVFIEYIGEEYNTFTVRVERLVIYRGHSPNFDYYDSLTFLRVAFPWEDAPVPFSEEETYKFIEGAKTVQELRAVSDKLEDDNLAWDTFYLWQGDKLDYRDIFAAGAVKLNDVEWAWWWEILQSYFQRVR